MVRKIAVCLVLVLLASSCSKYFRIDNLYDKGRYLDAYKVLEDVRKTNQLAYQSRELKIVSRLAMDGDMDFMSKLEKIVEGGTMLVSYPQLSNEVRFASTFLEFVRKDDQETYTAVLKDLRDERLFPREFVADALKIRGIAYYNLGEYDRAIEDLGRSYRMIPYLDAYYFIGMSYFGKEDYGDSRPYFDKIIRDSKNDLMKAEAYFHIGEIYYNDPANSQDNYKKALELYVDAVNCYCNSATYNYKIAKCLQKLGYPTLFPKFLKTCIRIQKDYANAWFLLNIN